MGARPLHSPAYRALCRLLRRWRNDAGLTQRELADRLRRPPSIVHKCEAAERRIDPLEFIEWVGACGLQASRSIAEVQREATGLAGGRKAGA